MDYNSTGSRCDQRYRRAAVTGILGLTTLLASTAAAGVGLRTPTAFFTHGLRVEIRLEPQFFQTMAGLTLGSRERSAFAELRPSSTDTAAVAFAEAREDLDPPELSAAPIFQALPWAASAVPHDTSRLAFVAPIHRSRQKPTEPKPIVAEQEAGHFLSTEAVIADVQPSPRPSDTGSMIKLDNPEHTDAESVSDANTESAPVQIAALTPHDTPATVGALPPVTFALPVPQGPNVFGSVAISAANAPVGQHSRLALSAIARPAPKRDCQPTQDAACGANTNGTWQDTLKQAHALTGHEQIAWLNRRVNELVKYKSDSEAHGVPDVWSTPEETMDRGFGDCEDYAVLKMWLLRQLGFNSDQLFVVVVRGSAFSTEHAVLAVRTGNSAFILDNRSNVLREDTEISEYRPLYSANENGLWVHASRPPLSRVAGM